MNLEQFLKEEIEHVSTQDNVFQRIKRKTVMEYLQTRLTEEAVKSAKLKEAEQLILQASRDKLKKHATEHPIKKSILK